MMRYCDGWDRCYHSLLQLLQHTRHELRVRVISDEGGIGASYLTKLPDGHCSEG